MKNTYTDKELIAAIQRGGQERNSAIQAIYQDRSFRQKVISYIKNNSGNQADGEDAFHEGLIVLDRNIRSGKFRGESSLKVYLFSICKFVWMNQIRKKSKVDYTEDNSRLDEVDRNSPEMTFMKEEKKVLLRKIVAKLGPKCQRILELWKLSYSMQEIAKEMGYSSAAMARKHKHKCHKSLVKMLNEHPKLMEMIK